MTTTLDGGSAKIYQFPLRGRFAPAGRLDDAAAAKFASSQLPRVTTSSGWYHDAAIQDERTRKD